MMVDCEAGKLSKLPGLEGWFFGSERANAKIAECMKPPCHFTRFNRGRRSESEVAGAAIR